MNSLIFGLHAVSAALKYEPERLETVWVDANRRDRRLRQLLQQATEQGVMIQRAASAELDRLSDGARHQGVVACCTGLSEKKIDLSELLDTLRESPLLLVLDGVQDPHNLGACLRSADAAGVHAVIAPTDRAVGLTPTVRKVACGAAETVPFIQVTNLSRTLRDLQDRGVWLMGATDTATSSLYQVDLSGPIALVLGAEDKGLRRLTRDCCDHLLHIPMAGSVASLNVSVATGVCLFEAVRQRSIAPNRS